MPNRILPIGVTARETGITKDLLRKWETRYGFPQPERSESGIRGYSLDQVQTLRAVKRLIDSGMRPGEAIREATSTGKPSQEARLRLPSASNVTVVGACLGAIAAHDTPGLYALLDRSLVSQGVRSFIAQTVAPLTVAVGERWQHGELKVHEEHLFTATLKSFLAEVHRRLQLTAGGLRVLLTTPPGELHTLGLDMVRVLLADAGAACISLGAQTPLAEMAEAAEAYGTQVLGLSFSAAYPRRLLLPTLMQLHALVPPGVAIWIGGAGALAASHLPPGVQAFVSATDAADAVLRMSEGALADGL